MREAGFEIVPEVLRAEECAHFIAQLSGMKLERSRAGARHVLRVPEIDALAKDERLIALASAALNESAVPFRATLFDKSPESNWLVAWHQDTALPFKEKFEAAGWGPWSMKAGIHHAHAPDWALQRIVALRVHLDESNEMNGPLRVLPGTHRNGRLTEEQIRKLADEIAGVNCLTPQGGILLMSPLIVHASSKSVSEMPRRVLHIEYAHSLIFGEGIELQIA